ncbi:MAG: glycosyltransferase 87 family protein, partial [Bacteroidota bacterium]
DIMRFWQLYMFPILLAALSFFLYFIFAYNLERTEYSKLILLYGTIWLVFLILMKLFKDHLKFLVFVSFAIRVIFLLAIPNLSQDFYRFLWDGRMILEGINPYLFTPESFIEANKFPVPQALELYNGMGALNGSHFTNYPPIKQLCFTVAALFSGHSIIGSVVVLRLLIVLADFGTFFFGRKLLKKLNLSESNIFWYILNPFIIIELTGNLHFEGIMIFFLVLSLYLLHQKKWMWAGVVFALSISVKLIPLLFLPLFFKFFRKDDNLVTIDFKKLIAFYAIIGITVVLLFLPFFSSQFITNYSETVALWFNNFEFNASIYYLAREIGYLFRGYNEIAIIGKILAGITLFSIVFLALLRRNQTNRQLIVNMLFAMSIYLFLSTTVHPWYLSTLLVLSIFTKYKFPVVWSFVIILSYLAYLNLNSADKSENLWVIALEYLIVFSVLIWEVFRKPKIYD